MYAALTLTVSDKNVY